MESLFEGRDRERANSHESQDGLAPTGWVAMVWLGRSWLVWMGRRVWDSVTREEIKFWFPAFYSQSLMYVYIGTSGFHRLI